MSASVFWASDPIAPGEIALLVGEDFGAHPVVSIRRLSDEDRRQHEIADEAATQIEAAESSSRSIKLKVPESWENGIFEVEVHGEGGTAKASLNAPNPYWMQGNLGVQASPGGWLRLFGRNIEAPGKAASVVLTSRTGDKTYVLKAESGSLWDARFAVPSDINLGTYDVRVHNGWGGAQGWRPAGSFVVAAAEAWPTRRFNVREFGAKGDGVADDSRAVISALDEAGRNGGGVVFLPRGRYVIRQMLTVPRFTELAGEGTDLAVLMFADFDNAPPALIRGSNHFGLRDIAIYASNHRIVIESDVTHTVAGDPGNVRIHRVRVRAMKYRGHVTADELDRKHRESFKVNFEAEDTLRLGGTAVEITESDFYGSGRSLALVAPRAAYVANNAFFNGRLGWYSISGADGVIFENNTITGSDLMATGGGINTLGDYAYSQNIWFGHNRLEMMTGWDREAMTADGPGGLYYGAVAAISATTLRLDTPINNTLLNKRDAWRGAGVFILDGRGAGQIARVKRVSSQLIELDHPLDVMPDASSTVTVTMLQQNYLFIDNTFVDAGLAIQYYGTSVNHVAAGNKSVRTGGMFASGRWYLHYQPTWYCQFLDNEITDGNTYRGGPNGETFAGEAVLGVIGGQRAPNLAPLAMGSVLRRNRLLGNAHIEVMGGDNPRAPGVRDVIVENNVIERSDVLIKRDRGTVGVLLSGNRSGGLSVPDK
jgi:hypothetical protein